MASRSTGIGLPAMVALVAFGCGGRATPAPTPLGGVAAVTAGGAHACALLTGGTARCWGDDAFGELGDGGYLSPEASVTVGLSGITAIAAGGHHTCALLGDGGISCFGNNSFGALGNGQQTLYELTPASVLGVAAASAIASTGPSFGDLEADEEYSCALLPNGQAACWGDDGDATLGDDGSSIDVSTPVSVRGLTGATELALGGGHACALLADGTAACWGKDLVTSSPTPTAVSGLTGVQALAAGSLHTCALLAGGTVACWGDNAFGQLGTGTASPAAPTTTPAPVPGLAGVGALSAGGDHTCALLTDGTIQCWGVDGHGELGDGTETETRAAPTPVAGIAGAVAVSAGVGFSCALLADGTVRCWGQNDHGQLGNGSTSTADVLTPVEVLAGPEGDGGSG